MNIEARLNFAHETEKIVIFAEYNSRNGKNNRPAIKYWKKPQASTEAKLRGWQCKDQYHQDNYHNLPSSPHYCQYSETRVL